MGIKRLGRRNLFTTERLGQDINSSTGAGMSDALISATQHREGNKLVTDLVFDLGTSKATIKSGGATRNLPIGKDGTDVSYLCKITDSVFGIVTNLEIVCLEAATDGTMTDYNLISSSNGTGFLGSAAAAADAVTGSAGSSGNILGTVGKHTTIPLDDNGLSDMYLYLGCGDTAGDNVAAKAEATITVGATTTTASFADNISRITLTDAGGTQRQFLVDRDASFTTQSGSAFNVSGAATPANIATGIKNAINGAHSFVATVSDTVVTVTQSAAGVAGNQSNFFIDSPGDSAGLTITDFTGGKTKGTSTAMTGGKFLLRTTGFIVPNDA